MVKKLLKIGVIQLVIVILLYACTGMVSNYYYNQTSSYVKEARNAGYNSKIEATLYDINSYTHEGTEYTLIHYGNTDLFGGHYSDYALIAHDTFIDKQVAVDKRFCLMYENAEKVTVYIDNMEQQGKILNAYNMVRVHETPETILLLLLICLPISGFVFVALAISAFIVHIVKKRKEAVS